MDYKDIHWLDTSSQQWSKWHKFGMTWWRKKFAKGMLKESRNKYICLFLFETCINLEYSEQNIFKAHFLLQHSIWFRCTDTHIGTSLNFAHCQFIQAPDIIKFLNECQPLQIEWTSTCCASLGRGQRRQLVD